MAELDNDDGHGTDDAAVAAAAATIDDDGTVVLHLTGEIDIATVEGLRASIEHILDGRTPNSLAFDLSDLRFMDSSGIALLLAVAAPVNRVEVRHPSSVIRRVIEISGLTEVLPTPSET